MLHLISLLCSVRIVGESLESEEQGGLGVLDADLPQQPQDAASVSPLTRSPTPSTSSSSSGNMGMQQPDAATLVEQAASQAFARLGEVVRASAEVVGVSCINEMGGHVLQLCAAVYHLAAARDSPCDPCSCLPAVGGSNGRCCARGRPACSSCSQTGPGIRASTLRSTGAERTAVGGGSSRFLLAAAPSLARGGRVDRAPA